MDTPLDRHPSTRTGTGTTSWWIGATLLAYLASAAVGFLLGFGFVRNAGGGAGMGLVAGLNGALFCTLLADWVLSRVRPRRTRH